MDDLRFITSFSCHVTKFIEKRTWAFGIWGPNTSVKKRTALFCGYSPAGVATYESTPPIFSHLPFVIVNVKQIGPLTTYP